MARKFEWVDREEAKEILLTNNPELVTMYNKDDLEEVVDGVCEDIEYVRKFMNGVNKIIAEVEKTNPELAKEIKDHFYNWYDDDEDYDIW
ncbi:MAG: hypothetical protein ACE364_01075 [Chlorobiota bacterium]